MRGRYLRIRLRNLLKIFNLLLSMFYWKSVGGFGVLRRGTLRLRDLGPRLRGDDRGLLVV